MVIVEARIDARPKDLLEQVTCIVECMGMNTVGKRQAIDHDVYLSCSEVVPDQAGHRSRNTSVCRRRPPTSQAPGTPTRAQVKFPAAWCTAGGLTMQSPGPPVDI